MEPRLTINAIIADIFKLNNTKLETLVQDNSISLRSEVDKIFKEQRRDLDEIQGDVIRAVKVVDEKIKEINELLKLREWVKTSISDAKTENQQYFNAELAKTEVC